jgi:murein DD-endopeptidase MepM/ murein hydrolase activator NlpD
MTFRLRTFVLGIAAVSAAFMAADEEPRSAQSLVLPNAPVELVFRALQPGEAVLAELTEPSAVKSLSIRLRGRDYRLSPGQPFAFLGLDLDLPVEPLPLELSEVKGTGEVEHIRDELAIAPKEFSSRRFRVDEAMLAPPSDETERVQREQVLVQAVFGIWNPDWLGDGGFVAPLSQEPFPNFGQRRIYNRKHTSVHAGVDIGAPWGTAIRASNAGRVVLASRLYLSGWTVILDHGQGVFTFYGHCSKFLVKRGDVVGKGQAIAKVGNTGRSTGPHLHWAARVGDSRVDPLSLLALPLQ